MKIDIEKLKKFEKLPPDVKRELSLVMAKWKEKKKQADIKNDFMAFVKHVLLILFVALFYGFLKKILVLLISRMDGVN